MPFEFAVSPVRLLAPCATSVAFLDNQHVIYISGRVAVIFNLITKVPTFLPPRSSLLITSSFCLSPDGYVPCVDFAIIQSRCRSALSILHPIDKVSR